MSNITKKFDWFSEAFLEVLRSHGSNLKKWKHSISLFKYVLAVLAAQQVKNYVFRCLSCLFPPDWNWSFFVCFLMSGNKNLIITQVTVQISGLQTFLIIHPISENFVSVLCTTEFLIFLPKLQWIMLCNPCHLHPSLEITGLDGDEKGKKFLLWV